MVAGGMIGVWVFTMFLLPSLICWIPIRQKLGEASVDQLVVTLGEFVIRNQKLLLIGIPVIIIGFGAGISQIKLEVTSCAISMKASRHARRPTSMRPSLAG